MPGARFRGGSARRAVLCGVLLAGDHLTVAAVAGILLVLAGTYAGQRVENQARAGIPDSPSTTRDVPLRPFSTDSTVRR